MQYLLKTPYKIQNIHTKHSPKYSYIRGQHNTIKIHFKHSSKYIYNGEGQTLLSTLSKYMNRYPLQTTLHSPCNTTGLFNSHYVPKWAKLFLTRTIVNP